MTLFKLLLAPLLIATSFASEDEQNDSRDNPNPQEIQVTRIRIDPHTGERREEQVSVDREMFLAHRTNTPTNNPHSILNIL